METFSTFILIIAIAWGVLNIILFFKIWAMCDNVNKIANPEIDEAQNATRILMGEKEEAATNLKRTVTKKMMDYYYQYERSIDDSSKDFYQEKMEMLISTINNAFKTLELGELPESLRSIDNFKDEYERIKSAKIRLR